MRAIAIIIFAAEPLFARLFRRILLRHEKREMKAKRYYVFLRPFADASFASADRHARRVPPPLITPPPCHTVDADAATPAADLLPSPEQARFFAGALRQIRAFALSPFAAI